MEPPALGYIISKHFFQKHIQRKVLTTEVHPATNMLNQVKKNGQISKKIVKEKN